MKWIVAIMLSFCILSCASTPQYIVVPSQNTGGAPSGVNINYVSNLNAVLGDLVFLTPPFKEFWLDGIVVGTCWKRIDYEQFIPVTPGTHKFTNCTYDRGLFTLGMHSYGSYRIPCRNYLFRVGEGQTAKILIDEEAGKMIFENVVYSYEEKVER